MTTTSRPVQILAGVITTLFALALMVASVVGRAILPVWLFEWNCLFAIAAVAAGVAPLGSLGVAVAWAVETVRTPRPVQPRHRPAPGTKGRAPSATAEDWTEWESERQDWLTANAWRAEEPTDVPPVDPQAAERPRPEQPQRRPRHGTPADIAEAAWAASEEAVAA